MPLLAAGLNAHTQLSTTSNDDVRSFTLILPELVGEDTRVLYAGWSTTTLLIGNRLLGLGHQPLDQRLDPGTASTLFDAFGDHNGLLGCLDTAGHLHLISATSRLERQDVEDSSTLLGHISLAGNDNLAISFKQAPNGKLCHILQFASLEDFLEWYRDPSGVHIDANSQHFMLPGRPKQMIANTASFLVLMEGGEVWSWGDPRFGSLGRGVVGEGEGVVPAERPGVVEALGGLGIRKVACGGWLSAALSEDHALYVWGTNSPGTEQSIKILRKGSRTGDVVLVDLPASREPLDVIDVAVGGNHIVAIAEEGRLFVVGENKNGQLGLNTAEPFVDDWTEVRSERPFQHVVCGPKATLAWTDSD